MQESLVSIIVPIYKVEAYLRRCLDSVINQSYTNLEIILVDDGSPDNCPIICDEYAAKDARIVVIHKKNGGLSDARNAGTKNALGDYIYYLDSDDELPLDSIQSLIGYVGTNPKAEIIVGKMSCPQDESLYMNQLFGCDCVIKKNVEIRKCYSGNSNVFPINACNKLIKRDFIEKNNISFKKGIIHEDELWSFYVSKVAEYIVCVNKVTYIRYLNSNSITTASSNNEKNRSWGVILKTIFSEINQPAFVEQFTKYYTYLNWLYPKLNKEMKLAYETVWKSCAHCAKRNNLMLLAVFIYFHKLLFNFLNGHGTGFAIWFLLAKWYKK